MYVIYTVTCTITNSIIYVGMTRRPLDQRLREHLTYTNDIYNLKKNKAFGRYKKRKKKPIIEELERHNNRFIAKDIETYWINQFKQWGFNLVNSVGIKK